MSDLIARGITDRGNLRDKNEDSYLVRLNQNNILAVADGMGGHKGGEVASSTAIEMLDEINFDCNDEYNQYFQNIFSGINNRIIDKGLDDPTLKGMGTTLSVCLICNDKLYYGHVGDSRIYLYRNENLSKLSTDHSYVNQLVTKGKISKEEAFNHPKRNILTQAIGLERNLDLDTGMVELNSGDYILICSDGLSDMVREKEIELIISNLYPEVDEINDKLLTDALAAGGSDNITFISCLIKEV
ncbi:Stp1/IreP family PP2C-type Ser/Thr phosphatase [Halanaerobiaceae bacterium Z-7014]|uniref:Stp1/IreP family PP2C-type Ser/Thr phosphatase n=1 Tax=Halonatronomonas betaini TaxID=2778430 RepID=A0A931AUB4_9FIRM|nr:Stp1/IreP family PP2C-type Ser/Thr phosphatase [Halonatronomonas betaini]MBF8436809.1 Stp1/IreP family PP2C-type Ser/Thr phosphatase [Halonatronomonas betaini]